MASIFPKLTGRFNVGVVDIVQKNFLGRLFYPSSIHDNLAEDKILHTKQTDRQILSKNFQDSHLNSAPWHAEISYLKNYEFFIKNPKIMSDIRLPDKVSFSPIFELDNSVPLVIYSHGLYGNRFNNSFTNSTIASHGYAVLALEHRDGTANLSFNLNDKNVKVYRPYQKLGIKGFNKEMFSKRDEQMTFRHEEILNSLKYFSLDQDLSVPLDQSRRLGQNRSPLRLSEIVDKTVAPIFIGHSFGAATGFKFSQTYEDMFNKLIMLDPFTFMISKDTLKLANENFKTGNVTTENLTILSQEFADYQKIVDKIEKIPNQELVTAKYSNHMSIGSDFSLLYEKMKGEGFVDDNSAWKNDPDYLDLKVECNNAAEILRFVNLRILRFLKEDSRYA